MSVTLTDQTASVTHRILSIAQERPDHPAVQVAGRALTYLELIEAARAVAGAFAARGLGPGDRVVVLGRESVEYYVVVVAAALSGTVVVPVNPRLSTTEVEHIVADSGAALVLADPGQPVLATAAVPTVSTDRSSWRAFTATGAGLALEESASTLETPLAQLYTSGTTGLPKGAVLAHRSFTAIADQLRTAGLDWVTVDSDDRCLIGIPGFHVGGLWFALQALTVGATVVGLPEFDPAEARRMIAEARVTQAIVVPAMLRSMLDVPGADPAELAGLRKVLYGGAPIAESLLRRCLVEIGCEFAQIYGLTETGNTALCLPPADHEPDRFVPQRAGRPYPGVEVRIIDEHGADLPSGGVGEVVIRTPAAMLGYHQRPDATAATLRDGWIFTGDAGELDAEGYLTLRDRLNDLVIVGGENVYPVEIENALCGHPAVVDAAVVGVPDDVTGEALLAFVHVRPGAEVSPRDLILHLRPQLAAFKLPRRFEVVAEIPRNPSGKILRRVLREPYWVGRERRVN